MTAIESSTKIMCRNLGNPQHFYILSFKVEGLKTKLDNPSFLELIQKYDITILTEAWKADTLNIIIEGFWDYLQVRLKHKNAIRHWALQSLQKKIMQGLF